MHLIFNKTAFQGRKTDCKIICNYFPYEVTERKYEIMETSQVWVSIVTIKNRMTSGKNFLRPEEWSCNEIDLLKKDINALEIGATSPEKKSCCVPFCLQDRQTTTTRMHCIDSHQTNKCSILKQEAVWPPSSNKLPLNMFSWKHFREKTEQVHGSYFSFLLFDPNCLHLTSKLCVNTKLWQYNLVILNWNISCCKGQWRIMKDAGTLRLET